MPEFIGSSVREFGQLLSARPDLANRAIIGRKFSIIPPTIIKDFMPICRVEDREFFLVAERRQPLGSVWTTLAMMFNIEEISISAPIG